MRPLALSERGLATPTVSLTSLLTGSHPAIAGSTDVDLTRYAREIVASGFPGLRTMSGRALRAQLDSYIERIVEHDFDELGRRVRDEGTLRRWMTAYAAATSTTASLEVIRGAASAGDGLTPARSTTLPYRRALEQLWIIDDLPGWLPTHNHIRRLAEAPRHHLADPALAARLLGVDVEALLDGKDPGPPVPRDGTLLGALFESLVTQSVRVYAQAAEARVFHLRTHSGEHEVDLIIERGDGRIVALEVKLARAVNERDTRHLRWLADTIGERLLDTAVITTGPDAYRRSDGTAIIHAALLGP
jgi:predicted AAA+ superfamily ATPase